MSYKTIASCAALVALATPALAGEGGDVFIFTDAGQVKTGAFSHTTESVISFNERVFAGEFGEIDPGQPNFSDEPGFRGFASDFPDGSSWSFDITGPVMQWNGTDFSTASPYTIELGFGPLSATSGVGPVAGFGVPVSGTDGFDDHLDILLNAPTDGTADGVYLLTLSLSVSGFADSDEIWFVLNRGMDEPTHDAALEYAEANVPTPGTLAVLTGALLGGVRRRR
ncbi:MAG: hypothetical protein ACF8GE_03660 [Phycisphaerales bacterium JB043]